MHVYNSKISWEVFPWKQESFPFPYTFIPTPCHSHFQVGVLFPFPWHYRGIPVPIENRIPVVISTTQHSPLIRGEWKTSTIQTRTGSRIKIWFSIPRGNFISAYTHLKMHSLNDVIIRHIVTKVYFFHGFRSHNFWMKLPKNRIFDQIVGKKTFTGKLRICPRGRIDINFRVSLPSIINIVQVISRSH